jgi:ferredoxin
VSQRLQVDPTRCEGHGACAELLPELVHLDEWGYPVLAGATGPSGTPVPDDLQRHARRAVALCPRLALRLVTGDDSEPSPVGGACGQA